MRSPPPLSHQRQQHQRSKMKPCPAKTSACSHLPVLSQPGPGPRTLLLSLPASPHTTSPLPSRFLGSWTMASPLPPGLGGEGQGRALAQRPPLAAAAAGRAAAPVLSPAQSLPAPSGHHRTSQAPWGRFGPKTPTPPGQQR